MRLRKSLFICALVLVMPLMRLNQTLAQVPEPIAGEVRLATLTGEAVKGREVKPDFLVVPAPLEIRRKDDAYRSAYRDVYNILSEPNPCSSFFGGPSRAVEVLNGLFNKLETGLLTNANVGLTMYGRTDKVTDARTGATYRLFEKAVINSKGPFYQRARAVGEPLIRRVGSFQPNTREARATILLHEMGHLLAGDDGRWLLPDDGQNTGQSNKNTETIETRCGTQIKDVVRGKKGVEVSKEEKGGERPSPQ